MLSNSIYLKSSLFNFFEFTNDFIIKSFHLITKGKLAIGKSGIVRGNIRCKNSDVEGAVDGKIYVEELLSLKSTANIKGEVKTGKLAIEPGAILNATCTMGTVANPDEERKSQKPVK